LSQNEDFIEFEHLPINKELYRKITKISYSQNIPIHKLVNDMLQEYLNVYLLSKQIDYVIVSKKVLQKTFSYTPDDEIIPISEEIAVRYREAAILLHGKPSLEVYLDLIKSFVLANRYLIEFGKSQQKAESNSNDSDSNDKQILIIQFKMGYKFSKFLGNAYRILLQEFCDVDRFEITDTLAFYEYRPRAIK
jgi:hypothetical protein